MTKKHTNIVIAVIALFLVSAFVYETALNTNNNREETTAKKSTAAPVRRLATFDKKQYSITDPSSIWVVVNKHNALQPKNYTPKLLVFPDVSLRVPGNESMKMRPETARALETMFADAKKDNLDLEVSSAHRSYSFQVSLYGGYVNSQGKAVADTQSARPGYSEHQTGLVADIQPTSGKCHLDACFGELAEGKWLKTNAYKYGFLLRYPADEQPVTGYTYEPWHFRYIGVALATEMHHQNIQTLEEFFDLEDAPDYN